MFLCSLAILVGLILLLLGMLIGGLLTLAFGIGSEDHWILQRASQSSQPGIATPSGKPCSD